MTILEKIAEIEAEMARTQKNKNTNYHLGTLKAKLSKLKSDLMKDSKGGPKAEAFEVSKSGDARIGLVGFPSVGKSTLMNKLTGQSSEVASYEFTTLTCVPGFFKHNGARFQLLDLPGIIEGAKDGKGRGRQVIATARSCSMILVVLDCLRPLQHKAIILKELEETGIRLNKEPPQITINRVDKGGLSIIRAGKVEDPILDDYAVTAILKEYKVTNAQVHIRDNPTADELIDAVDGNRVYIPGIFVMNKIDALTLEELEIMASIEHNCPVSAHLEWNLDGLIDMIWDYSRLTRIYTKPKGKMPDYSSPVVLRNEDVTIEDFCNKLHKTMKSNFRSATVWGSSVKFSPQKCGLHHVLADEDVVQIIKKI